ncbi:hypothetical protein [Bradyrhizobium sp. USDA 4486]
MLKILQRAVAPWCQPTLILSAAILGQWLAPAIPASAHVHHGRDGTAVKWYPYDCCHDGDCHPVSSVRARADGFLMTTEEGATLFVPSQKARRQSQDGRWHICFAASEKPLILCVFEPPTS